MSGYTRTEGRPQKDGTIPKFYIEAVLDEGASNREGRAIYRDVERIQYIMPGSPNSPVENVTDQIRARFREQYEEFKSTGTMALDGTPLEMWPALRPSQVHELKALQIMTVEQCANLSDTAIQRIPFGFKLRDLARVYVDDSQRDSVVIAQQAKIDALTASNAEQSRKLEELTDLMNRMHSQMVARGDVQHPVATYIPGNDGYSASVPVRAEEQHVASSLESLPTPRRGRPSNAERAARAAGKGDE